MIRLLSEVIKPLVAVGLAAVVANCTGCSPTGRPRAPTVQETYKAQIQACSSFSKSKPEAVECRRTVNKSWGLCGPGSTLEPC